MKLGIAKFLVGALTMLVVAGNLNAAEPKILYEHDPTLLITTIEVVLTTGGADDPIDKAGLSSLMSELMLRGTKKNSRTKFQGALETLGASLGVRTSADTIVFEGKVIRENTKPFLAMIKEFLLQPAFTESEFKALKKEQLAEIYHRKNNNARLAGLAARREALKGTTLQRSVEGGASTIAKITLDDIKRTYNDRLHQGNILFAVSAPVPEAEMKPVLNEIWTKFPDGLRLNRRSLGLSIPAKPTLIVVNKPKTSSGSLLMAQAGITAQEPDRFALGLGNFSFGAEPLVSRLFKVIRGELGWTYAIGSTYHAMGGLSYQQGLYVISSTPSVEYSVKTILKAMAMWSDYLENGLKGEELVLARESMVNSYPFEFDSAEKRLEHKLYSYLYGVPILTPEEYAKKINGVSGKELVEVLKKKHSNSGWLISITADAKEIEKQLVEEQKERPEAERLKIAKIVSPDEVIN